MKPLNEVITACPPSGIRRFFDIAAEMDDVISLGVGEPDFVTPWRIREAGIYALEHGYTTYTSNAGLPKLRKLICADLASRYGAHYAWDDECLITTGVSEGLDLALRVLLNPGDEVIVPEPCYVAYEPCVRFAGGVPVARADALGGRLRRRRRARWRPPSPRGRRPSCSARRRTRPARCSPARRWRRWSRWPEEHDLYLVSDEIYDRLTYEGRAHLPGRAARRARAHGGARRVLQGPGDDRVAGRLDLRARGDRRAVRAGAPVHDAVRAARLPARRGGGAASTPTTTSPRWSPTTTGGGGCSSRGCASSVWTARSRRGAFYAFPSIRRSGLDSETFAERLLHEHQVAVVPGNVFGPSGEGHVRCSYATALPLLEEALERMGRFLASVN